MVLSRGSSRSIAVVDVRLRRWSIADIEDVAVMVDDQHLRPWSTMGADLDRWVRQEIAEDRGPSRAICLREDDRAIGRVALRLPESASAAVRCAAIRGEDQPAGELSYWLVPAARGRGLAYSAILLFMDSVVGSTELRSVVLDIEVCNHASIRLAERLGAERRNPTRVEIDRRGVPRTLVTYVMRIAQ
ncbi:MAG: GNAT family N-acetyltransferase [Solirubrobacterales bacterium]|nr:GNAT family N-acetyltransferase [Solirubrobacterales bacterium]